jgi:hypothetical protein
MIAGTKRNVSLKITKGVIRSRKSKKRQCNKQKKRIKEKTVIHKTPHRKNARDKRRCNGQVRTSFFTSGIRRVGNHG